MNLERPVKTKGILVSKKNITETVLEVEFELESKISFIPGQFANIAVTHPFRRPYSILEMQDNKAKFLIEVRDPGRGSDFFKQIQVGDETEFLGPLGRFVIQKNQRPKVFISIGAGIAPFVSMVKSLVNNNFQSEIHLFQGMRTVNHDLAIPYLSNEIESSKVRYYRCLTKDAPISTYDFEGRVTKVVPAQDFDFKNTDFYVCGSNAMVKEMRLILELQGAENVFVENYG